MAEAVSRPGFCNLPCDIDEYYVGSNEMGLFALAETDPGIASKLTMFATFHQSIFSKSCEVAAQSPCLDLVAAATQDVGLGMQCPIAQKAVAEMMTGGYDIDFTLS